MHRHSLTLALATAVALAALAGCRRDPDPIPPDPIASEVAAPAAEASAVIGEIDHASPASAAPGFDPKAFAGTYAGLIPCADCPGIEKSIAFAADGRYTETMVYRERDTTAVSEGTWSVAADGKRLLLDPTDKGASDAFLEIVSANAVRMLDADGKAIASGLDYTLRRR